VAGEGGPITKKYRCLKCGGHGTVTVEFEPDRPGLGLADTLELNHCPECEPERKRVLSDPIRRSVRVECSEVFKRYGRRPETVLVGQSKYEALCDEMEPSIRWAFPGYRDKSIEATAHYAAFYFDVRTVRFVDWTDAIVVVNPGCDARESARARHRHEGVRPVCEILRAFSDHLDDSDIYKGMQSDELDDAIRFLASLAQELREIRIPREGDGDGLLFKARLMYIANQIDSPTEPPPAASD